MTMNELLLALQKAFAEFKVENDARLKQIETKGHADPLLENKVDTINAAITALETELAKLKSTNAGSSALSEQDTARAEHRTAFNNFVRHGVDAGLTELEIKAAMSVGTTADGGYTVPVELDRTIDSLMLNINPMRQLASVVQVGSPTYQKLVAIHGAASGWVGETAARTTTNSPQFAQVTPFMGELYANPKTTQQLLDDAFFDIEAWLANEIADQFAVAEGTAFTTGDGASKPKGILGYVNASTADGARAFGQLQYVPTGAAADFLTVSATVSPADVLLDMIYSLKAGLRVGASWQMNKLSVAKLRKVKDTIGDYIWTPPTAEGIANGQAGALLGYSINENEDMPIFGANAYPIGFGNWKKGYYVIDRVGTRVLRDPYTDKPYINFYTTKRVGGMVVDSEAIKLLKCAVS
jgi:HK97 family phage major capsid protein